MVTLLKSAGCLVIGARGACTGLRRRAVMEGGRCRSAHTSIDGIIFGRTILNRPDTPHADVCMRSRERAGGGGVSLELG